MNAIVPLDQRLPARAAEPAMPADLRQAVAELIEDRHYQWPVRFHPRAAQVLRECDHLCREAEPAVVRTWFVRLAAGVRNPPDGDDFARRVSAICVACHDLPSAVWTSDTLAEALRQFAWWPSAADVDGLLRPKAQRLWAQRNALQKIAQANDEPIQQQRGPRTDGEREYVRDLVKSFLSERSFHASRDLPSRARPRPHYLSPGHLLLLCEPAAKRGEAWAVARCALLRRQIGLSDAEVEAEIRETEPCE